MPGSEPVQSLSRGLDMLTALAKSEDGLRLNDVAEALKLSPSTAHNLIKTMRLKGFVEKGKDGKFRLGPVLFEIAGSKGGDAFQAKISAAVKSIVSKFPEAIATFSETAGAEIAVSLRMSPELPGVLQKPSGRSFKLYSSVAGLVHLAFADEEAKSWLQLERSFSEEGKLNWGEEARLQAFLKEARLQAFVENPFRDDDALRLGVPAFDSNGSFRGALCVFLKGSGSGALDRKAALETLQAAAAGVQSKKGV